jgi:hypothetical protein
VGEEVFFTWENIPFFTGIMENHEGEKSLKGAYGSYI